ncbi:MAG: hypothetical protein ABEK84_07950 [Salinibacter sp.]
MNEAFDPRLNDAYVRAVFRAGRTGLYPQATGAYLDLFEQASQVPAADPKGRQIIGRHVSQMAFLLSGGPRSRLLRTVDQEKVVAPAYALDRARARRWPDGGVGRIRCPGPPATSGSRSTSDGCRWLRRPLARL